MRISNNRHHKINNKEDDKLWRGVFYDTSFILLSLLTIANGLTSSLIAWFNDFSQFPVSPILIFTVFTIIFLHLTDISTKKLLILPCLVLVFFLMIPSSLASWVGLLIAAILYRLQVGRFEGKVVLLTMLALSFIWKNCLFKISSGFILHAETWFIGQLLSPFFSDLYIHKNHIILSEAHNISIGVGCSVFFNFSFVILGWVSMFYLLGHNNINTKWFLNIFLFLLLTNVIRIGLMSIDYQVYILMHNGVGANIYNIILVIISISPLFLSLRSQGDKRCRIE